MTFLTELDTMTLRLPFVPGRGKWGGGGGGLLAHGSYMGMHVSPNGVIFLGLRSGMGYHIQAVF